MKRKLVLFFCQFLILHIVVSAQVSNPGTQLARHIADKMKDSLKLNNQKRNQVFAINMYLHNRKMIVRQQTHNPDMLRTRLQLLENKRDSMYKTVLPPPKYIIYLQKKANLISSN